jgi:hypothetical protein
MEPPCQYEPLYSLLIGGPNHKFTRECCTYRKSARASSPSGTCKLQRTRFRRSFTPSPSYFPPPAVLRSTLSATCKKYEFVPLRRLIRRGSHTHDTNLRTQLLPKPRQQLELFGLYHSGISRHLSMQPNLHIADISALSLSFLLHISRMRLNLPLRLELRSTAYVMMPHVLCLR